MVEEYEEIADSQYPSERLEFLDEDYGKMVICCKLDNISFLTIPIQSANLLFVLN